MKALPFPTFADVAQDIAAVLAVLQQLEVADTVHVYQPHMSCEWVVWDATAGQSGERIPLAVWIGRQLAARSYVP